MNKKELEAIARKTAKSLKTEQDLNDFSRMLKKITVETALNAELDDHLGYDKHQQSNTANSRNGYSSKTLITEDGPFPVEIPRDREGSFEAQLVKKHQTRLTAMDDKIHCLYAKGMTTREIAASFKEMYDADVSPPLISKVTNAVIEQVTEWTTILTEGDRDRWLGGSSCRLLLVLQVFELVNPHITLGKMSANLQLTAHRLNKAAQGGDVHIQRIWGRAYYFS